MKELEAKDKEFIKQVFSSQINKALYFLNRYMTIDEAKAYIAEKLPSYKYNSQKLYIDIENIREEAVELNGNITRKTNIGCFKPGDKIFISEKLDGSNASIAWNYDKNDLDCFSRTRQLKEYGGLNGYVEWVHTKMDKRVKDFLRNCPQYVIFGEWCCLSGDTYIDKLSKGQLYRNNRELLTLRELYKKTHEERASWHYGEKLVLLKLIEGENKFSNILDLYTSTRDINKSISRPMARREIFKLKYKKLVTINEKIDKITITKKGIDRYNKYLNDRFPSIFSLFQDEWTIKANKIKDIIFTGNKQVYEVSTKKGFKIETTLDHKFLTPKGFIPLQELKEYDCVAISTLDSKLNSHRFTQNRSKEYKIHYGYKNDMKNFREQHQVCEICGKKATNKSLHLHHKDGNHYNNDPKNWQMLCASCHSKITNKLGQTAKATFDVEFDYIVSIKKTKIIDCYDICMEGTENCANFVANNFIVHNCKQKSNKISYNDSVVQTWNVFSIWNRSSDRWCRPEFVKKVCEDYGLTFIHELYWGPFISWEHCKSFLHKNTYGDTQEGIVVVNCDKIEFENREPATIKIVNDSFKESMGIKKPKEIDPEKEKAKAEAEQLMSNIVTQNRVEKILGKLQTEGDLPKVLEPVMMGEVAKKLCKAVYADCVKEEPEIMEACGEFAGKICGSLTMAIARKLILGE